MGTIYITSQDSQEENSNVQERKKKKKKEEYDHSFAISHAKSLQSLARELEKTSALNENKSDLDLFQGKIVGTPILFGLATEVALKALLYQETNEVPPYWHDLLELFDRLKENIQAELEATFKELGRNTQGRLMAELPRPSSQLYDILWMSIEKSLFFGDILLSLFLRVTPKHSMK